MVLQPNSSRLFDLEHPSLFVCVPARIDEAPALVLEKRMSATWTG
jgi:hypothetical protein